MKAIFDALKSEGLTEYAIIDFDKLTIINQRLLNENLQFKSALITLIPYRHSNLLFTDNNNVGLFARCMDYHLYAKELFERINPIIEAELNCNVKAFADHSPINEKDAALKAGLGFIGKNGLLINPRYGSYVFIAEFFLTESLPELIKNTDSSCNSCNNCINSCPTKALSDEGFNLEKCVSAISQKKTKSDEEKKMLAKTKTIWGCDLCQTACPFNRKAEYSTIDYFKNDVINNFTANTITALNDSEYAKYAFSYRAKSVITENCLTVNSKYDIID